MYIYVSFRENRLLFRTTFFFHPVPKLSVRANFRMTFTGQSVTGHAPYPVERIPSEAAAGLLAHPVRKPFPRLTYHSGSQCFAKHQGETQQRVLSPVLTAFPLSRHTFAGTVFGCKDTFSPVIRKAKSDLFFGKLFYSVPFRFFLFTILLQP